MQKFHRHTKQVPRTPVPGARCVVVLIMQQLQHTLGGAVCPSSSCRPAVESVELDQIVQVWQSGNKHEKPPHQRQTTPLQGGFSGSTSRQTLVGWLEDEKQVNRKQRVTQGWGQLFSLIHPNHSISWSRMFGQM